MATAAPICEDANRLLASSRAGADLEGVEVAEMIPKEVMCVQLHTNLVLVLCAATFVHPSEDQALIAVS